MTAEMIAGSLKARRCGKGWMAKCPAHNDRTPSLRIDEKNGRVLVHCFAGCSQSVVIHKLSEMGLWESEKLSQSERERRLLERYYQEQIRKRKQAQADAFDAIKLAAIEDKDYDLWKRACQLQYRLSGEKK